MACTLSTVESCLPRISKTMTAQEYLIDTLARLADPSSVEQTPATPIEDVIFAKVMSKKFRKLKAGQAAIDVTKKAIHHSVSNQTPIIVNVVFGGNKLWHFAEAPEIDWAEVFTTLYLVKYLKYIASAYEPGAYLEFYSMDVVLESMNNLPPTETDQYSNTFIAMLAWLRQYLPSNVKVGYRRYGQDYSDRSEYIAELDEAKAKVWQELGNKLPTMTNEQKDATELNVRLKPGQADDPLWREKVEWTHLSIERTKTMERYIYDPTMIPVCPTYFPGCITTGSTKRTSAKFWVAVGALERDGTSLHETVLTPKQLENAQFQWESVSLPGLEGKNFSRIRVIEH